MIAVSNEFKKAIKSDERRIKGYVEVLYDLPNVETTPSSTYIQSTYTDINQITNGIRVENLYGSIDYLPLDGTYLTMSPNTEENINSGYISNETFENINTPEFTINLAQTTKLNGVTLYFRTNIPTQITLYYVLGVDYDEQIITNNDKDSVQVIFNSPKDVDQIIVYINSMEYSNRKIYINEIDLGLSAVYKDQDLIEFTVDEEVNKLVEEVPTNETSITINNMYDLFNPLNPQGVVKYLTDGSKIIPHIGVLTETQGVEFVKMGEFYFDSYTNNSDKTTTLVGKNVIKRLDSESLRNDNESDFFAMVMSEIRFKNFMSNYDYEYVTNWKIGSSNVLWRENNLLKFLKDLAFWQVNLFYGNRDNVLIYRDIDTTIKDSLTKSELLNDVEYKTIEKLNTINIVKNTYTGTSGGSTSDFLKETVTLSKTSEVFLIISDSPNMMFATVSQTGGTSASIVSAGFYLAFVKVTGNIGSEVTLTFNGLTGQSVSQTLFSKQEEGTVIPKVLEFNSGIYYVVNDVVMDRIFEVIENAPSYEINFEYNGDPSLEAGDYIEVETPYGYKPVFIQKNTFRFNGGLSGSIEGVE